MSNDAESSQMMRAVRWTGRFGNREETDDFAMMVSSSSEDKTQENELKKGLKSDHESRVQTTLLECCVVQESSGKRQ